MAHAASLSLAPDAAPPSAEGCLDSITVHTIEQIAGTISELTLVEEVDGYHFDQSGLLVQVRQAYLEAMRGDMTVEDVAMVPLV